MRSGSAIVATARAAPLAPRCTRHSPLSICSVSRTGSRPDRSRTRNSNAVVRPRARVGSNHSGMTLAIAQPVMPSGTASPRSDRRTASAHRRWRPSGRSASTSRAGSSRRRSRSRAASETSSYGIDEPAAGADVPERRLLEHLDPVAPAEDLGDGVALGALGHHDPDVVEAAVVDRRRGRRLDVRGSDPALGLAAADGGPRAGAADGCTADAPFPSSV